jgi:hypothetical protein
MPPGVTSPVSYAVMMAFARPPVFELGEDADP